MPLQAKGSVFTAEVVTSRGGATGWADMRAAYEVLDTGTRQRLAGMRAYHSLYYSQGRSGCMPTKNEGGTYDMYGFHDLEPSLRPAGEGAPRDGPAQPAGRPPRLRHRGHGRGRVGGVPRQAQHRGLPAAPASTITSGPRAMPRCGTTAG